MKLLKSILEAIKSPDNILLTISVVCILTSLSLVIGTGYEEFSIYSIILSCVYLLPLFYLNFNTNLAYTILATICSFIIVLLLRGWVYTILQFCIFWLPIVTAIMLFSLRRNFKDIFYVYLELPNVLFIVLLVNITGIAILIALFKYNPEAFIFIKNSFLQKINDIISNNGLLSYDSIFQTTNIKTLLSNNFLLLFISCVSSYGLMFNIANIYVGTKIAKKNIAAKFFYWPSDLRLPVSSLIIYPVAITILVFGNYYPNLRILATSSIITLSQTLFLCGLAYLHTITTDLPIRLIFLPIFYVVLFCTTYFSLPITIVILLMGVWSTIEHYKRTKTII